MGDSAVKTVAEEMSRMLVDWVVNSEYILEIAPEQIKDFRVCKLISAESKFYW